MKRKYILTENGLSNKPVEVFLSFKKAKQKCWEMARQIAITDSVPLEKLEEWKDEWEGSDAWGVCPYDDPVVYWPIISIRKHQQNE